MNGDNVVIASSQRANQFCSFLPDGIMARANTASAPQKMVVGQAGIRIPTIARLPAPMMAGPPPKMPKPSGPANTAMLAAIAMAASTTRRVPMAMQKKAPKMQFTLPTGEPVHDDDDEVRPYKCQVCPFATKRKYILDAHMRKHDGGRFKCDECDFSAQEVQQLERHKRTHVSLSCGWCSHVARDHHALTRHSRTHERAKLECDECGYSTTFKPAFVRHMRTHDKPNEPTKSPPASTSTMSLRRR